MKAIIRKGGGLSSFIPMPIIIITLVYVLGYALAFCMLRIEQEADQEVYTKGDRAACVFISLLSFVGVLGLLIAAWVRSVKNTGYWDRPVREENITHIQGTESETEPLNEDDDDE